jgi:hypothetical protein
MINEKAVEAAHQAAEAIHAANDRADQAIALQEWLAARLNRCLELDEWQRPLLLALLARLTHS